MFWWFACAPPEEQPTAPAPAPLVCTAVEAQTGPQDPSCASAPFPRCGGDPTGTWTLAGACNDGSLIPLTTTVLDYVCPGDSFVTATSLEEELELAADGTFAWTAATTSSETWTVPAACYADLGAGSCADLAEQFGYPCTESGEVCSCTLGTGSSDQFLGGRWEVCEASLVLAAADGTLATTSSGIPATRDLGSGASTVVDFCADGDTLRLFTWQSPFVTGYTRVP